MSTSRIRLLSSPRPGGDGSFVNDEIAPVLVLAYLVLTFLPFSQLVDIPGVVRTTLLPVACVCVLVLTPHHRLARIPVSLPLFGFLIWTALSYLWSAVPSWTMYAIRHELVPMAATFLVAGTVRPRNLARVIMLFGITITLWGIAMAVVLPAARTDPAAVGEEMVQGFRGTFIHKNLFGMLGVLALAAALAMYRGRRRRLLVLVLVAGILLSRSATAVSGLLAVLVIWLWISTLSLGRSRRDRQVLVAVSLAASLLAVLTVLRVSPALLDLYGKDVTFSGRTEIWTESIAAFQQQPLQGFGMHAVFNEDTTPLKERLWQLIGFEASHAHNGVIAVLLDLGVVGLTLFAGFLVDLLARSVRALRMQGSRPEGRWALMSVLALVVMSFAEPVFTGHYLGYLGLVWTCMAGLAIEAAHPSRHPEGPRSVVPNPPRVARIAPRYP